LGYAVTVTSINEAVLLMLIKLHGAIWVALTALLGLFLGVVLSENAYYR
jgi:uncharacterized membrane protein